MKRVWRLLVEGGHETLAWMREKKRLPIGWGEIGDLRSLGSPEAIEAAIRVRNEHDPNHRDRGTANVQRGRDSLWDFFVTMKAGDLVIVSSKVGDKCERVKVWEVVGDYEYATDPSAVPRNYRHLREARMLTMNPDDLWGRAGGRLLEGQINYRTLGQCANGIE